MSWLDRTKEEIARWKADPSYVPIVPAEIYVSQDTYENLTPLQRMKFHELQLLTVQKLEELGYPIKEEVKQGIRTRISEAENEAPQ